MPQELQVVVGPGPGVAGEEGQGVHGAVQLAVDLHHSAHTGWLGFALVSIWEGGGGGDEEGGPSIQSNLIIHCIWVGFFFPSFC